MTKREITCWLIVDWRSKAVRVVKKKPGPSLDKYYARGYRLGEIPIEVNLVLNIPDTDYLKIDAEIDVSGASIARNFLKDIADE